MIYFVNMQYLSFWLCWKNSLDFCDCKENFFPATSWSFYRFDLPSTSTRKGITNPFPSWTCLYLLLSLFDLNCDFFIYFLLYNSALFLLCLKTFSSSPQSLIIVHIRHHAFTLSIIKTTLFVLLLSNIFPLFDDDNQWFITHQDYLLVIKTTTLCHPSKLQTYCFLIPQQFSPFWWWKTMHMSIHII